MNKFLTLIAILVSSIFAEDMDDRIVPDFKISIPKGDTNFNFNREVEIKKITLNDSDIAIKREMVKVEAPKYNINSKNYNGEKIGMYME